MKSKQIFMFFLILFFASIFVSAQSVSEKSTAIKLNLGASTPFGLPAESSSIIPNIGVDFNFGDFGVRAAGKFFKTNPEFDYNAYLSPISNFVTQSGNEKHSNLTIGINPYLNLPMEGFTLQPSFGIHYLSQNGADLMANYGTLAPGSILNATGGDPKRSAVILAPGVRALFGDANKPLRFFAEAGYSMPIGIKEYNITTRNLDGVLLPDGSIDPDLMEMGTTLRHTEKMFPPNFWIGIGLELNINSLFKNTASKNNSTLPDQNNDTIDIDKNILSIKLITPTDTISDTKPTFEWKANRPISKDVTYTVKVIPLFEDQKPENAIKMNKASWEVTGLKETLLPYPSNTSPLDSTLNYIWVVYAIHINGQVLASSSLQLFSFCFCLMHFPGPQPIIKCQTDPQFDIQAPGSIFGWYCAPEYAWYVNGIQIGSWSNSNSHLTINPSSLLLFPQINSIWWKARSGGIIKCQTEILVTVYPHLSAEIYEWLPGIIGSQITEICRIGADATLYVPNQLPLGYEFFWTWDDNTGQSGILGIGNAKNTGPIQPTCLTGQSFVTRTYSAQIIGTPQWPASCPIDDVQLIVWCPTNAGNIGVTSSSHTVQSGNNICSEQIYPINLQFDLSGNIGTIQSWYRDQVPIPSSYGMPTIIDEIWAAGDYTYSVEVQNGSGTGACQPETAMVTVTIEDPLTATITSIIPAHNDPLWICPDSAVQLQLNQQPTGTQMQWEYQINGAGNWIQAGNGSIQNTNSIGVSGPYNPVPTQSLFWRAIVSSSAAICNPDTSDIFHIYLHPPPSTPTITLSSASSLPKCPNDAVVLNASTPTSGNSPFNYQWYHNGILLSGEINPQITVITPGFYVVEVWADGHCSSSTSLPFRVTNCEMDPIIRGACSTDGLTTVTLTAFPNSFSNPMPQPFPPCNGPYTYTWISNGSIIGNQASITVTPSSTTTYCVKIIDGLGCPKTVCAIIKVCQ